MCHTYEKKVWMKTRAFLISMVVMLAVTGISSSAWSYSGIVSVDTIQAEAGDHVAIPIRLSNNDESISALSVPLHIGSPYATIDSVSFVGSLLPDDFVPWVDPPDDPNDSVFITLIGTWTSPTPTITVSEGIIAIMYMTVSPSAPDGYIPIDSFFTTVDTYPGPDGEPVEVPRIRQVLASDATGMIVYLPDFVEGGIIVMSPTAVDDDSKDNNLPSSFSLAQNYPNPFNPVTTIEYSIPQGSHVKLEVFNILGQSVVTLVDGHQSPGTYTVDFDAFNQPSGIYFYRLTHSEGAETRKMTLVK